MYTKNIELIMAAKKHHTDVKASVKNNHAIIAKTATARPNHLKMGRHETNNGPKMVST